MKRFWLLVWMHIVMATVLVCVPPGMVAAHMVHGQTPRDHETVPNETADKQNLERRFLSMMIPHHRGAMEMSRYILEMATDEHVVAWAKGIVETQEREIALMEKWLAERGGADDEIWQAMEAEMAAMMELLRKAEDPERAFVEHMVPHHLEAVEATLPILARTQDRGLLTLARDIVVTQTEEVVQFRIWLLEREEYHQH